MKGNGGNCSEDDSNEPTSQDPANSNKETIADGKINKSVEFGNTKEEEEEEEEETGQMNEKDKKILDSSGCGKNDCIIDETSRQNLTDESKNMSKLNHRYQAYSKDSNEKESETVNEMVSEENIGDESGKKLYQNHSKDSDDDENTEKEIIDIDEFLVRSGECSTYQVHLVMKIMLISIPLSFPVFIFYFISYDPPWINLVNATYHVKEDNARCYLNRSQWDYDYDKTTMTTEYDLICDKSWILSLTGSVVFVGWGIGSFVLGYLSDIYGRKFIMIPCIFLDIFCLFLHVFVDSIWWMIFIRFVMGFFHAGPALNAYILLVELIGPNYRVLAANVAGLIWGVGLCILALKAYLIDNWRTLCLVASAPYVGLLCIGFWFPESIRWLNANGRTEEAEEILHKAANINRRPVENVSIKPVNDGKQKKLSYINLFNSRKVTKLTLSQGFVWLNNGMSYYTLSWAFADLGGGNMYINFALASIVELPMHAVAVICMEKFGRKSTTWMSQLITGLACIVICFLILLDHFGAMRLLFGLLGKSTISLGFMCCYMWSAELFPTVVRTQGLGFTIITSRVGASISPFANNLDLIHPTLPFLVMAISSCIACLICFILPETLGKNTRETMDDMVLEDDK